MSKLDTAQMSGWRLASALVLLTALVACIGVVGLSGIPRVELAGFPTAAAVGNPHSGTSAGSPPSLSAGLQAQKIAQAKTALAQPAAAQQLAWGQNWLKRHGLKETGWDGCDHMFKSLCNKKDDDRMPGEEWYDDDDWLDYGGRLRKAHEGDTQREAVFKEAVKQLKEKVEDDRKDRKLFRVDRTAALKAAEDAIKARWQQEEDDSEATLEREKIEMDQQQAEVNAQYIAKIANMSTGRGEYAALMQKAHEEDVVRQAKFKQVILDMKASGASPRSLEAARSEFGEQERLFQTQLEQIGQAFKNRAGEVEQERSEAKQALGSYGKEQEKEKEEAAAKESEDKATEAAASKEAVASLGVRTSDNSKGEYAASVAASEGAEKAKAEAFEKGVAEARKKAKLHDEAMAKRAASEQASSKAEASKTTAKHPGEAAVGAAELLTLAGGKMQELVALRHRQAAAGVGKLTGDEKRRLAFFNAMAKKAAAQFKSMPTTM